MARFLYFSWVREKIGCPEEVIELPSEINSVAAMLLFLRGKGDPYAEVLAEPSLRVAVNEVYTQPHDPISNTDRIAIFPPVSGG